MANAGSILCLMEGENGDVFLERVCFGVLMHGLCGGIEGLLMKGCLSWCVGDDRGR